MILIDSDTNENAAPIVDWINAMERAIIDTAEGRAVVPKRIQFDVL